MAPAPEALRRSLNTSTASLRRQYQSEVRGQASRLPRVNQSRGDLVQATDLQYLLQLGDGMGTSRYLFCRRVLCGNRAFHGL